MDEAAAVDLQLRAQFVDGPRRQLRWNKHGDVGKIEPFNGQKLRDDAQHALHIVVFEPGMFHDAERRPARLAADRARQQVDVVREAPEEEAPESRPTGALIEDHG